MNPPREDPETESPAKRSGRRAAQSVVELCGTSRQGIMFWSRRPYDIGAQLQVRIKRECLPCTQLPPGLGEGDWVNLVGFVAASLPQRRSDGSQGFRIVLLIPAFSEEGSEESRGSRSVVVPEEAFGDHAWLGGSRQGWN